MDIFQPIWVVFVFKGTKTPGLFRLQYSAPPWPLIGRKESLDKAIQPIWGGKPNQQH